MFEFLNVLKVPDWLIGFVLFMLFVLLKSLSSSIFQSVYDPFGRPGAGAPLRDDAGIITIILYDVCCKLLLLLLLKK